jgi:hypothetical protein
MLDLVTCGRSPAVFFSPPAACGAIRSATMIAAVLTLMVVTAVLAVPVSNPQLGCWHHECLCQGIATPLPAAGSSRGTNATTPTKRTVDAVYRSYG